MKAVRLLYEVDRIASAKAQAFTDLARNRDPPVVTELRPHQMSCPGESCGAVYRTEYIAA